jgi:hypothetical protein
MESGIGNMLLDSPTVTNAPNNNQTASASSSLQTLLALSALSGDSMSLLGSTGPTNEPAVSEGQSLEAIRQGMLTAHTFLSTIERGQLSSHGVAVSEYDYEEKEDSAQQQGDSLI